MATSRRTNIDALIVGELQSLVCLPDTEIAFSPRIIRDAAQHHNGCATQAYQTSRMEYFLISVVSSQHVRHCAVVTSLVKSMPRSQNNVSLFETLSLEDIILLSCTTSNLQ